jgi:hypothetical protein
MTAIWLLVVLRRRRSAVLAWRGAVGLRRRRLLISSIWRLLGRGIMALRLLITSLLRISSLLLLISATVRLLRWGILTGGRRGILLAVALRLL